MRKPFYYDQNKCKKALKPLQKSFAELNKGEYQNLPTSPISTAHDTAIGGIKFALIAAIILAIIEFNFPGFIS